MTTFLVAVIIALLVLLGALGWLVVMLTNNVEELKFELAVEKESYKALDQGMDEMSENYEMDMLTLRENIVNLETEKEELEAHLDKHDRECLPNHFDASWRPHVSTDESVDPPLYIVP